MRPHLSNLLPESFYSFPRPVGVRGHPVLPREVWPASSFPRAFAVVFPEALSVHFPRVLPVPVQVLAQGPVQAWQVPPAAAGERAVHYPAGPQPAAGLLAVCSVGWPGHPPVAAAAGETPTDRQRVLRRVAEPAAPRAVELVAQMVAAPFAPRAVEPAARMVVVWAAQMVAVPAVPWAVEPAAPPVVAPFARMVVVRAAPWAAGPSADPHLVLGASPLRVPVEVPFC